MDESADPLPRHRRRLLTESIGIAVSAIGFGFVYGLSARDAGFSPLEAMAMSTIVFAGAAQFAAVGYVASGLAWPGVVLLTALLNARHLLYSAALAPWLRDVPFIRRAVMAHLLTDGAFFLHTWGLHQLPWQWEQLWRTAEPLLVMLPGLVLLAAGGPWHLRRQGRAGPALLFLGGGLLFLLTGGRIGTNWSFEFNIPS